MEVWKPNQKLHLSFSRVTIDLTHELFSKFDGEVNNTAHLNVCEEEAIQWSADGWMFLTVGTFWSALACFINSSTDARYKIFVTIFYRTNAIEIMAERMAANVVGRPCLYSSHKCRGVEHIAHLPMLIAREYHCPTESEDLQLRHEKIGNELVNPSHIKYPLSVVRWTHRYWTPKHHRAMRMRRSTDISRLPFA